MDLTELHSQSRGAAYLLALPAVDLSVPVLCAGAGGSSGWGPGGLSVLLPLVPLQKPRIWNWVFSPKSIFLSVPHTSQVM